MPLLLNEFRAHNRLMVELISIIYCPAAFITVFQRNLPLEGTLFFAFGFGSSFG